MGARVAGGCGSSRPCSLTMAVPAWSSGMQPLSRARWRAGPEPAPRLSRRGGSRRLRRAAAPGLAQASASFSQKLKSSSRSRSRARRADSAPREAPPPPSSLSLAPPPLSLRRLNDGVSTWRRTFSPSWILKRVIPPQILSF